MTSEDARRPPGTTNASDSATEESLARARGRHPADNPPGPIDGAADAPPGTSPAEATPDVSPGGDPLSEAHERDDE